MTPREETIEHIRQVGRRLHIVAEDLIKRAVNHDASKLEFPEWEMFEKATSKLRGLEYGSEEYMQGLKDMGPSLAIHYLNNDHHPQHFPNGIKGMSLIHLVEMLMDWLAAVTRHEKGDIMTSIKFNQERFGYSDDVRQILENTVAHFNQLAAVAGTLES